MSEPKGKEEEAQPRRKVPTTVDIAPTRMAEEVFGVDAKRADTFAVPTATRHMYKPQMVATEVKQTCPGWLQLAFALGFGILGYLTVKYLLF